MSIIFGGFRQLGMVVRDCEAAMEQWGKLGVGPFFMMRFTVDDFMLRGRPSPAPDVTLCFAHSGPLQIELIQQNNDVPSVWREFLDSGRVGAQHLAAWYADHPTFDAKMAELDSKGFEMEKEGGRGACDARLAYRLTWQPGGVMLELPKSIRP